MTVKRPRLNEEELTSVQEMMHTFLKEYPSIGSVLIEFEDELDMKPDMPFDSDEAYFWYLELKYLVKALHQTAYMELIHLATKPDDKSTRKDMPCKISIVAKDRDDLIRRWELLKELYECICVHGNCRLKESERLNNYRPRVARLGEYYHMNETESRMLEVLAVYQGCQSNAFRCHMLEDDTQRKMLAYQRLAGLSDIDLEDFHRDEREHVKEGTLVVDEEHYGLNFKLSNITVRVLLGRKLTSSQMLKVSQTGLEKLLKEEGISTSDIASPSVGVTAPVVKIPNLQDAVQMNEVECEGKSDSENDSPSAYSFIGSFKNESKLVALEEQKAMVEKSKGSNDEIYSYSPDNQLEYLEDRFQVVALAIRASGARVKDQMKEAGTKQPWDSSAPPVAGRRELKAKQKLQARRVAHKLALTRNEGKSIPRLEEMAKKFKLNEFEQNVIVMLIGKTVSPVIKNLIDNADSSPIQRMDDSTTINQILSVFCDTFREQVAHRVYFYKSSRLLSRGLVKLTRGRWHSSSGDLVDQRVELDRRVLDWVVGLDTEINEMVEGSDLYSPKVHLAQVVLPEDHKEQILETVKSYEKFRKYRKKINLDETISYGVGLVLLLAGASGTGKSMTVNAIANELGKRVLLVDFPSLQGKKQDDNSDADLRGLFREAEMSNAVLFFDECESIFKQRDFGGDRLLNSLLTEIERYEGIVFLATNRPFDLDEAMHRRITAVFEFRAPDHLQRREIWRLSISKQINVAKDIDWDRISLKYELSGGFIKNAILSALLKAIARDAQNPVVTEEDIVNGCTLQMRGSLHMKTFDHRVVPSSGFEDLIMDPKMISKLSNIVHYEKARSVIYGQWGFTFGDTSSQQKGITALLWGPSGVGKVAASKAIGFEVGRPLKMVNFSQLQGDTLSATRKALETVFADARLMDAVLVLDGFETFGSQLESMVPDGDSVRLRVECSRLMGMMESFPGIVLLIANDEKRVSSSTLHPEFSKRLTFIVEFKVLSSPLRSKLWKSLFPEKAPLSKDVDFKVLGERYELPNSSIASAVFRAAASAAFRPLEKRTISMKDLEQAAEIERRKARGGDCTTLNALFV